MYMSMLQMHQGKVESWDCILEVGTHQNFLYLDVSKTTQDIGQIVCFFQESPPDHYIK